MTEPDSPPAELGTDVPGAEGPYRVRLDVFEGPLDLLLYLIRKERVSIYDIPIAKVTQQYLETIEVMQQLDLDVAADFLVMAAKLAYIKSRMLLPLPEEEEEEEGEDPRAELVRALLEYERYRRAAGGLAERPLLGRDRFVRAGTGADPLGEDPGPPFTAGIFDLVSAFRDLLNRLEEVGEHAVVLAEISLANRVSSLLERLPDEGWVDFEQLFEPYVRDAKPGTERVELVVTFLAVLELMKLRVLQAVQERRFGPIRVERLVAAGSAEEQQVQEDFDRFG